MQFSTVLVAAAAFALANAAQFTMPASFFSAPISVGSTANITWSGASGPVTLLLKNGPSTNLQTVTTIASGLTGTSYAWTPSSSLASGQYAFEIDDGTTPNYSAQFTLSGGSASASSSVSGSTTGSSTSSGSTTTTASTTTTTSFSNSTVTTSTSAKTSSSTTTKASTTAASSSTSTSTSTPNSNSAASFASPLAFVFLAFAAMMTIN